MKRVLYLALAFSVAVGMPTTASAQASPAVSPATQTIEDYGRELRRSRKMARACGATKEYMEFLSFSEGVLIAAKAEQQRALGVKVEDDARKYVLGFEDDFDVTVRACERHRKALAPIIVALDESFQAKNGLALYLPPTVACPTGRPC